MDYYHEAIESLKETVPLAMLLQIIAIEFMELVNEFRKEWEHDGNIVVH